MCLRQQEGLLHPLNMVHVRTLEMATVAATEAELWDESEIYATKLVQKYELVRIRNTILYRSVELANVEITMYVSLQVLLRRFAPPDSGRLSHSGNGSRKPEETQASIRRYLQGTGYR